MIKKYHWLILVLAVVFAGGLTFVYFFHHSDTKAFVGLAAAYEKFDQAMADFSAPTTVDVETKVSEALTQLEAKAATFRISSLVKHDAELMQQVPQIAGLARQEFIALQAYKQALAGRRTDTSSLASQLHILTNQRQAAYADFRKLAGL